MRSAVLDVGTGLTKAGFSGEEAPRAVFRSCVGEPRPSGAWPSYFGHPTDAAAGDEAHTDRGLLSLEWPVRGGHVVDPARYEALLYYSLYRRLAVVPDVTPVLLLEPADQTRASREQVAEILFESFNAPLLGMLNTATATVCAAGRTTGAVVDSGAGKTMISAVCDGYSLQHSMRPSAIAGDSLTDDLVAFLKARGYPMSVDADWELAERLKKTLCYASVSDEGEGGTAASAYGSDGDSNQQQQQQWQYPGKADGGTCYELPDSERIFLLEAEAGLAERLFNPSSSCCGGEAQRAAAAPPTPTGYSAAILDTSGDGGGGGKSTALGWVGAIQGIIAACSSGSLRAELYGSVVLGGGTTLLRDVERRLQRDLTVGNAAAGIPDTVHVVALPHRAQAAWIGGSVWSSSPAFPTMCLSKVDYYESGPGGVHRNAF